MKLDLAKNAADLAAAAAAVAVVAVAVVARAASVPGINRLICQPDEALVLCPACWFKDMLELLICLFQKEEN
jgi:hypothetical protein